MTSIHPAETPIAYEVLFPAYRPTGPGGAWDGNQCETAFQVAALERRASDVGQHIDRLETDLNLLCAQNRALKRQTEQLEAENTLLRQAAEPLGWRGLARMRRSPWFRRIALRIARMAR